MLNSCLCLTLETGGLIIGWIYFIFCIFGTITSTIVSILTCVLSCKDFQDYFGKDGVDLCETIHGVIIGVIVITILLCIGFAFISWRCIQGVNTRNHARLMPMMILLAILTVLSALQISDTTISAVLQGLIGSAIHGFCFVVIYSLYERFRREPKMV